MSSSIQTITIPPVYHNPLQSTENSSAEFVENAILSIADVDQEVQEEQMRAQAATLALINAKDRLIQQQTTQIAQLSTALIESEGRIQAQKNTYVEKDKTSQELIQQLLSVVEEQKNQMKRMDEQLAAANKEIADCAPLKARAEHERRLVTDPAYRAAYRNARIESAANSGR